MGAGCSTVKEVVENEGVLQTAKSGGLTPRYLFIVLFFKK
jgi:hypothetical protein